MMKGLMDRCASHETVLGRLGEKVEAREMELCELMAWKEVQVNKLDLTKKLLEESVMRVEVLKEILKDKEREISEAKSQLRRDKEDAVREYRNSNALLKELVMSPLSRLLMTTFVRLKPFSLIWTFHMSLLTPKLRLQTSPSIPREPTNFSLRRPILTLKVTGMLPKLIKKNLSRTLPVTLKEIRLWKRRMKGPL